MSPAQSGQEVRVYSIGKTAALAGVTPDTLRYYEKEQLVAPASKTRSGYRLYDQMALRRLRFIRSAQQCGFSLAEIRELLSLQQSDTACCRDVRSVALQKRLRIESKLRALQAMSVALGELIARCEGGELATDDCTILAALEDGLEVASRCP